VRARYLLVLATLAGCARVPEPSHLSKPPGVSEPPGDGAVASGVASYYAGSLHGRPTASGERYDRGDLTAAHRALPFGTCLVVLNEDNGRSVRVRVNDRGPYAGDRLIDLSEAAARELGMLKKGLARVRLYRC
jgi:rare lipoprotein A